MFSIPSKYIFPVQPNHFMSPQSLSFLNGSENIVTKVISAFIVVKSRKA